VDSAHKHRCVLLGSAGTGTAFGAACALRRVWSQSVRIIAMDINPRHLVTTSLLADAFEQVPLSANPDFPATLSEIIRRHHIDTYLPLLPDEILLAAKLRSDAAIPKDLALMAPHVSASAACADKEKLSHIFLKRGIPVPKTAPASQPFAADEFFLKRKNGTGSRGAAKIKSTDLNSALEGQPDLWIVQEICSGPEVTIDAFVDPKTGFSHSICRERIEIKSGVSTKSRLFSDAALNDLAHRIAECLELSGSFCFQVMRNSSGWAVTDVNPRPGAATAMCAAAGSDFFAASFALQWAEDYKRFLQPLETECFVTRQYTEFLMGSPASTK
jgi:carbamoylphosphate synthase large subunit